MLAFRHIYEIVREKKKYQHLEMGWTLEENESINALTGKPAQEYIRNIAYSESLYNEEPCGRDRRTSHMCYVHLLVVIPAILKHSGVGNPAGKIPDKPTVGWPEVGAVSIEPPE